MTQYTTTSFNFPRANFVGFDRLFDELTRAQLGAQNNYPPHNVVKIDDDNYIIELAVAGFKQENLDIQLKDSILTVTGKKEDTREYAHKGISSREFVRTFTLGEHVQVTGANLADGILAVNLERIVPEDERPKKIEINTPVKTKKGFLKD